MSASKDKLNRKQLREAGQDKRALAQQKEEIERRKSRVKYSIVAAVIVVVFAFIFLFNSALPSRMLTGATIDGQTYSVAQVNYYYSTTYQNFYSTYGQYIQYGLFFDTSSSLEDQAYSEDMSWRDYFLEQALASMKQVQALCDAGEAAGFELPEEYQTSYDEAIAGLDTTWQTNGYSNLKQFLNLVYGRGVDEDLVKTELYRNYYASAYAEAVYDAYEYTPEELSAYYEENADTLDVISYATYSASVSEDDDGATAESFEALVAAVDGTDEDQFASYVENTMAGEITSRTSQGGDLSDIYGEWLLDDSRAAGDCEMVETDSMIYAVMFLGRDDNQYSTRAFRHILVMAEDTDGDEVTSTEEIQAASDRANEIYEEWLAGDATEDSFATLANLYSDDTGSNTTGGLYEEVYKNEMVAPVNDWLFDPSLAVGDTAVVDYNEGGSYVGTHVLYYVGQSDEIYADQIADSYLRSNDSNEWLEDLTGSMDAAFSNLGLAASNY